MIRDNTILENQRSLLQAVRQPEKVINLDFSNKLHRSLFLSLYGGYENIKKSFPCFYQAYQRTKEFHEQGKGLDYKTLHQEDKRKNFVDGIDISYVNYEFSNKMLNVEGIASLVEDAGHIDEHLDIRTAIGEPIAGKSQSTPGTYRSNIKIRTDFRPEEFQSSVIQVDYTVVWMDKSSGLLKAQVYSKDTEKVYVTDFVEKVALTFPVSEAGRNPIVICYNRLPSGEVVDRTYEEAIQGGVQKLLLDFNGNVTFKKNTPKFLKIDPTSFLLKLVSRGMAQYRIEGRIDDLVSRFTGSSVGFDFSLDYDWHDNVPTARLPIRDMVDIQMRVSFYLNDGNQGEIIISSTADATKGNVCKAVPLLLLWGCLSKDSLITMADGTKKTIDLMQIGEKVRVNQQVNGIVTNIWTGMEEDPLLRIETSSGKYIKCTALHPIITSLGIKAAEDIRGDDILIDEMGRETKVSAVYPVFEREVMNLDLSLENGGVPEQGMTMVCNGLMVGDNNMQNHLFRQVKSMEEINVHQEECIWKNNMFREWGK